MCQPDLYSFVRQPRLRLPWRIVGLVLLAAIVAILSLGIVYLWWTGRERECRRKLRWFSYVPMERICADPDRAFLPCAYFMDGTGKRMHSWRSQIIGPVDYMECNGDYVNYKYDEPWDSPHNAMYQRTSPCSQYYSCPVYAAGSRNASYLCVLGSRLWPIPRIKDGRWNEPWWRSRREGGVLPSHGKAIFLVEVVESDIPWTKPEDMTLSEIASLLREDTSGERFRGRVRNVVVIDADIGREVSASVQAIERGKAFTERAIQILDPARTSKKSR